ncbi:MAG: hypothetical protein LBC27_04410 [Spirochaetaceae bacterium]|jgi:hypothetical protein|nr:hypothetical protein [Spirochaetaceae bacterium]
MGDSFTIVISTTDYMMSRGGSILFSVNYVKKDENQNTLSSEPLSNDQVTWKLASKSGIGLKSGTTIANGLLKIASDETKGTLCVTATYSNNQYEDEIEITVTAPIDFDSIAAAPGWEDYINQKIAPAVVTAMAKNTPDKTKFYTASSEDVCICNYCWGAFDIEALAFQETVVIQEAVIAGANNGIAIATNGSVGLLFNWLTYDSKVAAAQNGASGLKMGVYALFCS